MKLQILATKDSNIFVIDLEGIITYRCKVSLNMKLEPKDRTEDLCEQIMKELVPIIKGRIMVRLLDTIGDE